MFLIEYANGSRSSEACFLLMNELYLRYLNRTSMGMRLPCKYVWPFRNFIAKRALYFFLKSTNAQNCVSSNRTV